jgi:hypothetical protein
MSKPKSQLRTPKRQADFIQAGRSDVQTSELPKRQTSRRPDVPRTQTTIYFDAELRKELRVYCAVHSCEMSQTVNEAVRDFLARASA